MSLMGGIKTRLKIGSTLGPFKIIRLLGKGGMGEVYEAIDQSSQARVALKVVAQTNSTDHEAVTRFETEGRALASVRHPNLVGILGLDSADEIHYIAMEYVDGIALNELLSQRALTPERALPLFLQLLNAVNVLHKNAIIHRDLKPKNILYLSDNTLKIIDFGVAKLAREVGAEITRSGTIVGSVKYVSPEVASGQSATYQSDIWSLGLIFYEMLVGHNPYTGKTYTEVLDTIRTRDLNFPMAAHRLFPSEMVRIITKMTSKDLQARYQNVQEVLMDLERLTHVPPFSSVSFSTYPPQITNLVDARRWVARFGFSGNETKLILARVTQNQVDRERAFSGQLSWNEDPAELELRRDVIEELCSQLGGTNNRSRSHTSQTTKRRSPINWYGITGALGTLAALAFSTPYIRNSQRQADRIPAQATTEHVIEAQETPSERSPQNTTPHHAPIASAPPARQNEARPAPSIQAHWPQPGRTVWQKGPLRLHLKWTPRLPGVGRLQFSLDRDFEAIVFDRRVEGSELRAPQLTLEDGPYYWRIVDDANEKVIWMPLAQFHLVTLSAPKIKSAVVDRLSPAPSVRLSWQPIATVHHYEVQIAEDSAFRKGKRSIPTSSTDLVLRDLGSKSYFWRIRGAGSPEIENFWSATGQFQMPNRVAAQTKKRAPAAKKNLKTQRRNKAN